MNPIETSVHLRKGVRITADVTVPEGKTHVYGEGRVLLSTYTPALTTEEGMDILIRMEANRGHEVTEIAFHPKDMSVYMKKVFVRSSGPNAAGGGPVAPRCVCGAAKVGAKDYAQGHSGWCEVAEKL